MKPLCSWRLLMTVEHALLLGMAAVALYLLGQVWLGQLVIYALFTQVGPAEYGAYHRLYNARIPLPVALPGFASCVLPCVLVFHRPAGVPDWMAIANVACGLVGFLITVKFTVPRHNRLEYEGKQDHLIREVTALSWLRTLSITGSAVLSCLMLGKAFTPA
jgi:hypothetical protein